MGLAGRWRNRSYRNQCDSYRCDAGAGWHYSREDSGGQAHTGFPGHDVATQRYLSVDLASMENDTRGSEAMDAMLSKALDIKNVQINSEL